jgi:RNA polymerase sigma-70 factor, ECF subfamily
VVSSAADDDLVSAIERVYRDDYPRFLRVATAIIGDMERGRDAVQEGFARALRSRRDLRRIESLEGWIWQTVVNVCRLELRHKVDRLDGAYEASWNGHADDWPEVRAAIAALPERQRLVLFLRHYADLDYHGIAEAAGIERGTVSAALHAAHRKIREAMTEVRT